MTTVNPLGTKTFWVNVFEKGQLGVKWLTGPAENPSALYRLKVRPWIPHDGDPCPVAPHVLVRVRMQGGWVSNVQHEPAGNWASNAHDQPDHWVGSNVPERRRIAAYQIIKD